MDKLIDLYREAFRWDACKLDAVRLAMACYLAPRWPGRPSAPWATLIGPPSCGKSTILGMFDGFDFTVSVDHLTRNALTSCYSDEENPELDHSFFMRLSYAWPPEGAKCWIIQELSTLLSMDPLTLEKHLADLRAAHVGKHTSHGGMGGTRTRDIGVFGLVVGTTEAFELIRSRMNVFGDRFLSIRMARVADSLDDMLASSREAWRADSVKMDTAKKAIKDETHRVLTNGIAQLSALGISECARNDEQDLQLSAWSTIHSTFATSPVSSAILVTAAGRPYRIVEQVKAWGNTHAIMCGRDYWNDDEMRVARRLFQDSMPRGNFDALVSIRPGVVGSSVANSDLFRQWAALGAVESDGGGSIQLGRERGVRLTPAFSRLITESGYFDQ